MTKKTKVGVLFGGKSPEHEVSLQSARNIIKAIDQDRFDLVPIAIDKEGKWFLANANQPFLNEKDPLNISINPTNERIAFQPGSSSPLFLSNDGNPKPFPGPLDVIFPVLHGAFGEDGSIQGLLKYLDIPCVGPGILGSAISMDKDIIKRLLRDAGVKNAKWILIRKHELAHLDYKKIEQTLGLPMYIKPANLGSSVGVHRVTKEEEFLPALLDALSFDTKVIIEETIEGREVECAILGNNHPQASTVGEVLTDHVVYSYEAKYLDQQGSDSGIPADLDPQTLKRIQDISIQVYQIANASGLSRIDSFLKENGEIYVNEINTIPGFTDISMYPKLWEASGIQGKDLLSKLLDFAIQRHQELNELKTSITSEY